MFMVALTKNIHEQVGFEEMEEAGIQRELEHSFGREADEILEEAKRTGNWMTLNASESFCYILPED